VLGNVADLESEMLRLRAEGIAVCREIVALYREMDTTRGRSGLGWRHGPDNSHGRRSAPSHPFPYLQCPAPYWVSVGSVMDDIRCTDLEI
jgi:hypothetical protein